MTDRIEYVVRVAAAGSDGFFGIWQDRDVATAKYRRFIGQYGRPGITVRLLRRADHGDEQLLARWPDDETGEGPQ